MKFNNKGFSLVELLVASTIVALLAAAGMVSFTTANRNARNAKRKSDIQQVRAALELYRTEEGCYPSSSCGSVNGYNSLLSELEDEGFLSNTGDLSDPKASPHPGYSYSNGGSCSAYELCAVLEPDDTDYCQCNP